jgi:polysulfide reductase chain C
MVKEMWGFPVALYLFVGGLTAASHYISVLADLSRKEKFKNIARAGSYAVLIPITIGLLMLIIDLGQPLRFWHLLFQLGPLHRGLILTISPMSIGTWVLVFFSFICGVFYPLFWLAEERFARNTLLAVLAGKERLRRIVGICGLPFSIIVAAYTGVLLATSGQPVWASTPLLPVLFVISATSTGFAAVMLMTWFLAREDREALATLEKGDNLIIKLEIVIVAILFAILFFFPEASPIVRDLLFGTYAVLFWLGFVGPALVLPLFMQKQSFTTHTQRLIVPAALLVLIGGFYLRFIVLLGTG